MMQRINSLLRRSHQEQEGIKGPLTGKSTYLTHTESPIKTHLA